MDGNLSWDPLVASNKAHRNYIHTYMYTHTKENGTDCIYLQSPVANKERAENAMNVCKIWKQQWKAKSRFCFQCILSELVYLYFCLPHLYLSLCLYLYFLTSLLFLILGPKAKHKVLVTDLTSLLKCAGNTQEHLRKPIPVPRNKNLIGWIQVGATPDQAVCGQGWKSCAHLAGPVGTLPAKYMDRFSKKGGRS